jgi:hypothetical protein
MSHLLIDDRKYSLPKDLTLGQWKSIVAGNTPDEILCAALDITADEMALVNDDIKSIMITMLFEVLYPKAKVNLKVRGHKLIDFESISLGTFIDLDVYLTAGLDKRIVEIVNLLYGAEEDWLVSEVWGAIQMYIGWKSAIYQGYPNLFTVSGADKMSVATEHSTAKRWFDLIMVIANDDVLRMDAVTELPLKQAFNWLAWNKERKLKEHRAAEQQRLQNKTR